MKRNDTAIRLLRDHLERVKDFERDSRSQAANAKEYNMECFYRGCECTYKTESVLIESILNTLKNPVFNTDL